MKRQPGLVSFVDVGCAVWSTTRSRVEFGGPQPVGGLVVGVTESFDGDTGEVARSFLVFDHQWPAYPRWATLTEAEVDRDTIEALDVATLSRVWRRLGRDLAFSSPGHLRTGPATAEEVRIARAILEIQAVVFGRDGLLHGELEPGVRTIDAPMPTAPANVSALVD